MYVENRTKIAQKSPIFPPPRVFNAPDEGVPLGIWYGRKGSRMLLWWRYQMVEKSFQIRLVILIQYRLWQTATQPASVEP